MTVKNFLTIGGIVLVVVGLGGMVGILGPTADSSVFGSLWWFDNGENWAHLILGVAALIVVFAVPSLGAPVTLLVGVLGLLVGLWGFALMGGVPNFYGANLENPADNILHLAVGAWALLSWMKGRKSMSLMSPMGTSGM
ncbi:MAG: hypothetical protein AAB533_00680 [Patescibacteria group bacterium]